MNKKEAIELFVNRDLQAVPQEWVSIVAEAKGEYYPLPMWGTMFLIEDYLGENIYNSARAMLSGTDELKDEIEQNENSNYSEDERAMLEKALNDDDWTVLEEYIDEEMAGARCVLDKDGDTTALYIYDIDGQYVLGVNGAGWNFYDGVWDKLYDLLGLKWHEN